jgi:3-keto-disaccharide hydrolase
MSAAFLDWQTDRQTQGIDMRNALMLATLTLFLMEAAHSGFAADDTAGGWHSLPLIKDGKVDPAWVQIGYGSFTVADGGLKTNPDPRGLGLLLYREEKLGNCQIRVDFRSNQARCNSGVYVRIDDGILDRINDKHAPGERDAAGKLTQESNNVFKQASEKEVGPWYAVHHGYEIQISDNSGSKRSRTGAVYSLAESVSLSDKPATEWKTMIITLKGTSIFVDIEGKRVTTFDSASKDLPPEREWFQPKREPVRPTVGYIGLQTHDPGDIVYFKDIAVRPLSKDK